MDITPVEELIDERQLYEKICYYSSALRELHYIYSIIYSKILRRNKND